MEYRKPKNIIPENDILKYVDGAELRRTSSSFEQDEKSSGEEEAEKEQVWKPKPKTKSAILKMRIYRSGFAPPAPSRTQRERTWWAAIRATTGSTGKRLPFCWENIIETEIWKVENEKGDNFRASLSLSLSPFRMLVLDFLITKIIVHRFACASQTSVSTISGEKNLNLPEKNRETTKRS